MHAENQGGGWGGLALSTVLFRYVTLDTEETSRRAFDVAKPHYLLSITLSYQLGKWPNEMKKNVAQNARYLRDEEHVIAESERSHDNI